jgi:hypothetical protein
MSDDPYRAKLEALEAEVKAASAADAERKARARAQVEARRAAQKAESDQLRSRQAALVRRQAGRADAVDDGDAVEVRPARKRGRGDELGSALELARRASDAKHELSRPIAKGEKSWLISGALSLFFGPVGWLYAGSWRESLPAAAGYLTIIAIVTKILPFFLLMPVLMFALPLSGIAGVVYAIGYNRNGHRVRLFGDDDRADDDRRIGKLGSGDRRDD